MLLHPQVIEKEGRMEFVVLPYEEFLQIQEALEDLEDLRELRKEREESDGHALQKSQRNRKRTWF